MFRKVFKRLRQDEGEIRAQGIRAWADSVPGTVRLESVQPRTVARVAGQVESIKVRPREGVQAFEAVLSDGTGMVLAVWLGRRTVPGLTIGSRLVLEGTIGGGRGQLQVMNPRYEFAAGEH